MPDAGVGPESSQADAWLPPWWLLVFAPLGWLLIAALALDRRGLLIALVVLILLAPVGMPAPPVLRWLRRHRRFAGVHAGPLAFAATTALTDFPLWLCTAVALGALLLTVTLTTMSELAGH
ncbi:hypothetical protein Kfla_1873 [Kribbella flavida DSM 17836]|uniref:Uncharacterized protein n=1 Tax=Kribbella flavida (strain DSM 17836 / JCM 10339 / NBRC 14399) TaxID=479435 RepID=D2PPK5_KRIFD|nr:hypothetical protein [Kribbella flavida]ADB30967.1 hypothetical protein Kfla_1873 [Kribbella flavida DSM 17836]